MNQDQLMFVKKTPVKRARAGESGQGLTEYLSLLFLISLVSIAAAKGLGGTIKRKIQEAQRHVNSDITLDGNGSGD